jgi:hypothetical protein
MLPDSVKLTELEPIQTPFARLDRALIKGTN